MSAPNRYLLIVENAGTDAPVGEKIMTVQDAGMSLAEAYTNAQRYVDGYRLQGFAVRVYPGVPVWTADDGDGHELSIYLAEASEQNIN